MEYPTERSLFISPGKVSQDTTDPVVIDYHSPFFELPLWRGSNISLHRQVTGKEGPNICLTAIGGMQAVAHGTNMLYFDCQLDAVRLTKHLRGTCKSEQKKRGGGSIS